VPPTSPSALDELAHDETSRKKFLRMMGGGGAAAGLAVLLAACGDDEKKSAGTSSSASTKKAPPPSSGATGSGGGDVEIVNYALTLEYLEATFYAEAAASGMIKDKKTLELAKQFGETEQTHVDALKAAVKELGGTPVEKPKTAFGPVIDGGPEMILMTAATVENLGAAAYLGQAGNIESKDILASALAIHSVEARHAAALNELVKRGFKGGGALEGSVPDGAFAKPMTMEQVLEQVKPFLAS
jgi:rubrerythrin